MARTLRFHLDEHCHSGIATGLRQRGIDVTTTVEAGLLEQPDKTHLAHAQIQERVILTHDPDFLRMNAAGVPHAGIAFCAAQSRSVGDIIEMLAIMWEIMEPEEMRNRVEYI